MSKIQDAIRKSQRESGPTHGQSQRADGTTVETADLSTQRSVLQEDLSTGEVRRSDNVIHFDQAALRNAGLIASQQDERLLSGQFREIKRPLIANAYGKREITVQRGSLIMIASALAGEGKSFIAINLALNMSREKDHSVLLVDADVAKPHISDVLGAGESKGLFDLLDDTDLRLDSVIQSTDIPGLKFMPAGKPRPNATELFASGQMDKVMAALSERSGNCLVIFDSTPVLQTSESKVLASLVGQIVMVVRAEETPKGAVMTAVDALGDERPVNLILNQARSSKRESHYGLGYSYSSTYGQ